MSISQENKDVNDIINEWTKTGGRDASNKACKAIREYYKQEQLKKQIIQQGAPVMQQSNLSNKQSMIMAFTHG